MPRLVLVEWRDSRQPEPSWQRLSDVEHSESCSCISVGFIVHDDDADIVLAPNLADFADDDLVQGSGFITIPKCSVKKVADLNGPATAYQEVSTATS